MIIAEAGRRIDAADATQPRFPLQNADAVRRRIYTFLADHHVTTLVCAAACGADLLALDAAGELGIRRRVVLPYEVNKFREASVTDRPGEWGTLYDRIIKEVEADGELVVMSDKGEGDALFAAANRAILDEAEALTRQDLQGKGGQGADTVAALIVWDGQSRGEGDLTLDFADEARRRGLSVFEILTK